MRRRRPKASNVIRIANAQAQPDECTKAVLLAEERYERQTMARRQDRKDALFILRMMQSPTRLCMNYKKRHRLSAFYDGECTFIWDWRLK